MNLCVRAERMKSDGFCLHTSTLARKRAM